MGQSALFNDIASPASRICLQPKFWSLMYILSILSFATLTATRPSTINTTVSRLFIGQIDHTFPLEQHSVELTRLPSLDDLRTRLQPSKYSRQHSTTTATITTDLT